MDSDTMICPMKLLQHVERAIQCGPVCAQTFYIGNQNTFSKCGGYDHCPREYTYASGVLHFLSQDLVQWIKTSTFAAKNKLGYEDLMTGSWLHASMLPVKYVNTESWEDAYLFNNQGWTAFLPGCRGK